METSALVATMDLFIKSDQELAKTAFEQRITGNCPSILHPMGQKPKFQKFQKSFKNPRYCKKSI